MKLASRRNLRRMVGVDRRKIIKQMRKDLIYLIKPKPKYVPKCVWVWLLSRCVNYNPNEVVKICHKPNK